MADSRDIVVSVNVIRDPRGAVIQTQLIKNEPPYVKAGIVTTIVGKDGSLIYTGSGVPSNELGVFTDIYIDTDTPKNFYQKNSSNVWVLKGSLQGGKGDDGREILIQNNGTYIQWQYEGDVSWTNIVALSDLKGDTGSNIELQKSLTHIQWRVVGDIDWINLIAIADLKGADGYTPIKGVDYFDGRGIVSFDLIDTQEKTKTYRLLYTDATYVDINIIDGNDGNDGTGAYQIYLDGGGTLSEVDFNESITDIPAHIGDETIHHTIEQLNEVYEPANSNIQEHISDETIHHTIEELNLLYSDINHNHNLNDLTEKSYNSLTDKPDLSSLHTHANKEDLDNYDPDNFEPANSNIQSHISNTNIHIDSSSELGVDINESTHSLFLWNGLKALKVTFARLKTWIGSYFLKLDQSTPQTINGKVTVNGQVDATTTDVNQSTIPSVNASQTAAILQDRSAFTGTDYIMPTNNVAVKIVASAAHTMGDFTIRVKSSATLTSTTATLTGYLYSDNAGSPGTLLATGNAIRHGSITTSYQELSLGTQYNMVSGTTYWLVVRWNSAPTGGNIILDSNVSSNLGATSADATTWILTNVQLRYRLRGRTYYGINAFSTNSYGVYGQSINSSGVYGNSTNSYGVNGFSTNSIGVRGLSTNSWAVYGQSTNSYGVYGLSTNSIGVYGVSTNNVGVFGTSTNNVGVYGVSTNSYSGYFIRNTQTPTNSVSVLYAYQQHASNTNSVFDIRQNGTGEIIRGFANTTQTFSVTAAGLGIFAKGVQIGDNTDVASAANKGATRYRENEGGSFCEMVMKKQDGTYAWTTIVSYQ